MFSTQPTTNFSKENENKLYKPNEALLLEIERTQKLREFERFQRKVANNQDMMDQ